MSARFSEMNERFDFLYRENEKRGQEYLVITERLNRIDTQLGNVEETRAGVVERSDEHEQRLQSLEKKCA